MGKLLISISIEISSGGRISIETFTKVSHIKDERCKHKRLENFTKVDNSNNFKENFLRDSKCEYFVIYIFSRC